MTSLILIRHSIVRQQPEISAHQWQLTDEGRARGLRLAEQLRRYQPGVVVTSAEPKAVQTGQLVAQTLDLPLETEPGLHEHLRESAPYYPDPRDFEARIEALLQHPDQLVFGDETGNAAGDRLQAALEAIIQRHPHTPIAAVSHGTVMSLFLARVAGVEPVSFWQTLGMPGYVVLRLPDFTLDEIVHEVQ